VLRRSTRNVELTAAGAAFLSEARELLAVLIVRSRPPGAPSAARSGG
jgi:DNA-binding transcriptional LysR family regulator